MLSSNTKSYSTVLKQEKYGAAVALEFLTLLKRKIKIAD